MAGLGRLLERVKGLRRERRERAALAASALFDPAWYVAQNPDVAASGRDPATHYIRSGAAERRRPSPWFDADWYVARNADVASLGQNPLVHYILFGAAEGRDPNPFFATRWYRSANPGAAAYPTPLDHYLREGRATGRDPSPLFDTVWYAERNPDLAETGLDPLGHFLLVGRAEGRASSPYGGARPAGRPLTEARLEAFKPLAPVRGGTLALFVAHAPDGRLKPNVAPYVSALAAAGVQVALIAAADRPFVPDPALTAKLAGGYVRDNRGYDFAAWAHLMQAEPGLFAADTVLLLNDSLIGPPSSEALKALLARMQASPADVVGACDSREHAWHLQSFFLAFKRPALASTALHGFFGAVRNLDDKDKVIRAYEVPLAAALQAGGLSCEALFPSADGLNQTVFHWRELVAAGFPFVKTLTLRGGYEDVDVSDWRQVLGAAGYDLDLVQATLDAPSRATGQAPKAWPLIRDAADRPAPTQPWKVGFIGPWNYGSGLGSASRGYVSALWRAGVRLNLYPVERPFHVHARVAPTVDVRDFEGQPDALIVHMNPDSWHLLSEAHLDLIARARKVIGLWTWEMGHLPEAWRPNLGKVDAIWAPSRYCAEVFEAETTLPVHVVPHAVPVPPGDEAGDRARTLAEFGLPADARIVLYAFDGSSYLVRKNPEALIRAFGAAGLAAKGWRLVLKTKNLMDRPKEGQLFTALAGAAEGVTLIDRGLSQGEMAGLFAAADIYASPHRSEGFGLTIAEAMAMGKPVVATDFGGSRDFLDATCGYPVAARTVKLDRDFGHYTKGGVWGEVDEGAFADALRRAAQAVDAGDRRIGEAARARVAEALSFEAVAAAMRDGLQAAIAAAPRADAA